MNNDISGNDVTDRSRHHDNVTTLLYLNQCQSTAGTNYQALDTALIDSQSRPGTCLSVCVCVCARARGCVNDGKLVINMQLSVAT